MAEGGKVNVEDGKSTEGKKENSLITVNFLFGKCHMIITSSLGLDWQNTLFDSFSQAWW